MTHMSNIHRIIELGPQKDKQIPLVILTEVKVIWLKFQNSGKEELKSRDFQGLFLGGLPT